MTFFPKGWKEGRRNPHLASGSWNGLRCQNFGDSLVGVWKVLGNCLEVVGQVSGGCLEGVLRVSGQYLEGVLSVTGIYWMS